MSNPIKPSLKTEILPIIILIITCLLSVFFFINFPEHVPVHWNFAGEVDRWGSKMNATLFVPAIMLFMYLLLISVPYLDPRKNRYKEFARTYHIFKGLILLMLFVIYLATGLNALGYNIPIGIVIPVAIGLLFIAIGNYLGKVKSNWFFGIRNPWTLSSDEVWNKVHRFGGKIFITGGLLMMIEPLLPLAWRMPMFIFLISLIIFGTLIYSYILYRKK